MFKKIFKFKNEKGLTLIEILVSLFVIMLLGLSVYGLIILSLNVTSDNKMYIEALNIANQQMEQVFNLPYDSVGLIDGNPEGVLSNYKTVERAGTFEVYTDVSYYDDPYDGLVENGDLDGNDYKLVTITVVFKSKMGDRDVTLFSKIVPNSL